MDALGWAHRAEPLIFGDTYYGLWEGVPEAAPETYLISKE